MNMLYVQNIILAIGIPAMVTGFIYIGRRMQILDDLVIKVNKLEDGFSNLKNSFSDFTIRFVKIEERLELLWKDKIAASNSPRELNPQGQNILTDSSIKEIIDNKQSELILIG